MTAKGSKVTCNSLHPGIVTTEVTRNFNALVRIGEQIAAPFLQLLRKTAEEGAFTTVHAAVAPELEGVGGLYLSHCEAAPTSAAAKDGQAAERLWALSERLTGLVQ